MTLLSKFISKFNTLGTGLVKVIAGFFVQNQQAYLKISVEIDRIQNSQNNPKKEVAELTLDFKI